MTLPTSCAAMTFAIRPSSARMTTCVAQPYAKCVTGFADGGARLGGPVDQHLAVELLAGEISQASPVQPGLQLAGRLDDCPAAQHGGARGCGLAAAELVAGVDDDPHLLRRHAQLLAE